MVVVVMIVMADDDGDGDDDDDDDDGGGGVGGGSIGGAGGCAGNGEARYLEDFRQRQAGVQQLRAALVADARHERGRLADQTQFLRNRTRQKHSHEGTLHSLETICEATLRGTKITQSHLSQTSPSSCGSIIYQSVVRLHAVPFFSRPQ